MHIELKEWEKRRTKGRGSGKGKRSKEVLIH